MSRREKPYPDYPLSAHPNGQWVKKIKGKLYYFGTDADVALQKYLDERDDLQAGRKPRNRNESGCRLGDLCNEFLTSKKTRLDADELSALTFQDYHRTCERLVNQFGRERLVTDIDASDFEDFRASLSASLNPTSVGDVVRRSRMVFKFGYDQGRIEQPVRYGQSFSEPSQTVKRRLRQKQTQRHGHRMFESAELQRIIADATSPLKAMILLGVNCGFGQKDCSDLPQSSVDLEAGWLDFPRPKTAVERRCPLWRETLTAIEEALAGRPAPVDEQDETLCFITARGHRWTRTTEKSRSDLVAFQFSKLLKALALKRPRIGFYTLRHTFETVAGGSRDQVAVDAIMGHVDGSTAAAYRERIDDDRLIAVTDYVHDWLFGKQ